MNTKKESNNKNDSFLGEHSKAQQQFLESNADIAIYEDGTEIWFGGSGSGKKTNSIVLISQILHNGKTRQYNQTSGS